MASAAMEMTEDLQVQDAQEKQIWSEEMEQQVQENANDGEPQENSLIAGTSRHGDRTFQLTLLVRRGS